MQPSYPAAEFHRLGSRGPAVARINIACPENFAAVWNIVTE
jgi:hypothetical protein